MDQKDHARSWCIGGNQMNDPNDLDMYSDDGDGESAKPVRHVTNIRVGAKLVEMMIFDQKITMVNPEYVETLQQTIEMLEKRIRDLDLTVKRLNNEVKIIKTGSIQNVKR
jgi:hypothetical protein